MKRSLIAWVTLTAFLWSSWACVVRTARKELPEQAALRGGDIIAVYTKSGEIYQFDPKKPARIWGDVVVGSTKPSGGAESDFLKLKKGDIQSRVKDAQGNLMITLKNGSQLAVRRIVAEDPETIVVEVLGGKSGELPGAVKIPLADVELVQVRRVDGGLTFLATMGGIALTFVGVLVIAALTKESCPFIYSWNGEGYVFDAEPYGGAICPAKKRTEWCALENLRPDAGRYRLKLTNEVDETQFTDELKLVVVDHAPGLSVAPDETGRFHGFADPVFPKRAYESNGRDILPYVAKTDWISWQSREDGRDPGRAETLRDELIFEFPKPAGAARARLLFNGCNTLWGSQMLKRYLELYGSEVRLQYERFGDPLFAGIMRQWNLREELYMLQARVETSRGWATKAILQGGGPFISEERVYEVDLRDVEGETLRLRLTPPAPYWMLNSVAVDYGPDLVLQTEELAPARAEDFTGADVRDALLVTDNIYQVMPRTGNWAEVEFIAPPEKPGSERTVFAKVSGYYDIHLEAQGEPRRDILNRFLSEPGYAVRFGYAEYIKWKDDLVSRHPGAARRD